MNLYLDIDGVLLDYNTDTYAKGAIELIEYVTSEFDCYWLSTHCKGDSTPAIENLSGHFPPEILDKMKKHPNLKFIVTKVGCSMAGYKPSQIAPFFEPAEKYHIALSSLEISVVR